MGIMARLAIVFCLIATGLAAEDVPALRQLDLMRAPGRGELVIGLTARADWAALGRLNKGGIDTPTTCTAVLIAPDLVLTAGHCVHLGGTPEQRAAKIAELRFVAGWNRGSYAALGSVSEAMQPPGFALTAGAMRIASDLTILRLSEPLPDSIAPMPIGPPPGPGEELAYIGYTNRHRHAPRLHAPCTASAGPPNVVVVDCQPSGGNSGSPLLRATTDGWEIAAIMVARGDGIGFATLPGDWVSSFLPPDP